MKKDTKTNKRQEFATNECNRKVYWFMDKDKYAKKR